MSDILPLENSHISFIIFGASGDLTEKKLVPALFDLFCKGSLSENMQIIGVSRTKFTHDTFRGKLKFSIEHNLGDSFDSQSWNKFEQQIYYFPGDAQNENELETVNKSIIKLENENSNRIYYLSTMPSIFPIIADNLAKLNMSQETNGWRRIVIEKPFGNDLTSAVKLNEILRIHFSESQIFRMDHYLGKEPTQNLLFFRFANAIFEPLWNRNYIDNVQISVLENIDIGKRAAYYDNSGVLRDMFQNHLLQLLALIAMEPPDYYETDAVRTEKYKVFHSIRPIELKDSIRGQYIGYKNTDGINPESQTATYAALKLHIDNWRWKGVPFYLRSGKSLSKKSSQIIIEFKCPPHNIFRTPTYEPNMLSLIIEPYEEIHLKFQTKVPDVVQETQSVDLAFHYKSYLAQNKLPSAYERLLSDVINGNHLLFPRSDAIEATWDIIDPVIKGWESDNAPPICYYDAGSKGPVEADILLANDGNQWLEGCDEHYGE